nr:MAG TPA: hypothetical protein [Caudoviricetes sp.]
MSMDDHVELIAFPSGKVHEAVTLNEDGSATIFLDKNATKESQMKRFMHVIKHLDGFDFDKSNVQEIEINAHTKESL